VGNNATLRIRTALSSDSGGLLIDYTRAEAAIARLRLIVDGTRGASCARLWRHECFTAVILMLAQEKQG